MSRAAGSIPLPGLRGEGGETRSVEAGEGDSR